MKINEIFYSLQGEGILTGLPNIFIRTTGCNLRCLYCDTKYAYFNGKDMTIDEIFKKIKNYNCKYVCITGGEPLIQEETIDLIRFLLDKNYIIILETNGSKKINKLSNYKNLVISMDIKCPSSGMHDKNLIDNIDLLRKSDQLKFIIKTKNDYNYAKKIFNQKKPNCNIFFQPVWNSNPKDLADWIITDNLNVRMGIQLHKIIWDEERGK